MNMTGDMAMVYTVTFNPSLDYIVSTGDFKLGMTNRTKTEQMFIGGKGINVSIVLNNLCIKSRALGFTAGFTGAEIEKRAAALGIDCDFIRVKNGFSRINVKLKDYDGTELNGKGPKISSEEAEALLEKLDCLRPGDVLVLAGSIPESIPGNIYGTILERLKDRDVLVVADTSGDLLLNVLKYRPFLIKPNHHELGEIFDADLKTRASVVPYAQKLQKAGARNVLVSMAGEGAVFLSEKGSVCMLKAPEGRLVNAVGAGDSMVAGFIAGWLEKENYDYAFKMGVAAGSASAFSEFLATEQEIETVYRRLYENKYICYNER